MMYFGRSVVAVYYKPAFIHGALFFTGPSFFSDTANHAYAGGWYRHI